MPKLSFLYVTGRLVLFYISTSIIKIFRKVPVTERTRTLFQIKQNEITKKFLYMTPRLVLCYISTKYHKNIPKGIRLTEPT